MFEKLPESLGNVVGYKATGTLSDADYKKLIPELDSLINEKGEIGLLLDFEEFDGWSLKAAFDDFRFAFKHHKKVKKFALVGDKKWEEEMAKLAKIFVFADARFFETSKIEDAWEWLKEGSKE
ncbi:STAS/SEC14 domain-containing protein [Patescibacteria group bacterium]|nr:STAS/SEC14 domain-containing protein [Patescibacteria group bacterium]